MSGQAHEQLEFVILAQSGTPDVDARDQFRVHSESAFFHLLFLISHQYLLTC